MDIKKIAFIVYRNNASCFSECVRYIKELYVPEGYSVDILANGEYKVCSFGL